MAGTRSLRLATATKATAEQELSHILPVLAR
jgi:hypothetical protein